MREVFQVVALPVDEGSDGGNRRAITVGIVFESDVITFVSSPSLDPNRHSGVYKIKKSYSPGPYRLPADFYFSYYDGVLKVMDTDTVETLLELV